MCASQFDAWLEQEIALDNEHGPDDMAEFMAWADSRLDLNPLDDPAFVAWLDAQELLPRVA